MRAKHFIAILLTCGMTLGAMAPANQAKAALYGAGLKKLNKNIKLGSTQTFEGKGKLQTGVLFEKAQTIHIKYTVKSKRVKKGKNYKATFKVKYVFQDDPKLQADKLEGAGYEWTEPSAFYTVFDYKTGKNLERKNNVGVSVKGSKWKQTYYPKQYYQSQDWNGEWEKVWYRNEKTISYTFTVTYPKKNKYVSVGIGFTDLVSLDKADTSISYLVADKWKNDYIDDWWDGKCKYGKTGYYKKGKNKVSYVRLS